MEVSMTRSKQQIRKTENELTEAELRQVSGGCFPPIGMPAAQEKAIIAVAPQRAMGDGSVKPVAPTQNALIGLL
jgi:bacteriocin-like protein